MIPSQNRQSRKRACRLGTLAAAFCTDERTRALARRAAISRFVTASRPAGASDTIPLPRNSAQDAFQSTLPSGSSPSRGRSSSSAGDRDATTATRARRRGCKRCDGSGQKERARKARGGTAVGGRKPRLPGRSIFREADAARSRGRKKWQEGEVGERRGAHPRRTISGWW